MELAVVTGAASGLGRALVCLLLKKGYQVAALDLNIEKLEGLKKEFEAMRNHLFIYKVDVTNEEFLRALAKKIKSEQKAPYLWVNNAGCAHLGRFHSVSSSEFKAVMDVNFFGVLHGVRAALDVMCEPTRGVIVNVASLNGQIPASFMASYVASKHAVVGLTRSLRLEFEQTQSPLRTLLVLPGFFKTDMIQPRDGFRLPSWVHKFVARPEAVAQEIIKAIDSGVDEVYPTRHGKLLLNAFRFAPKLTSGSSRLLIAKNWKQLLGLDPIE